MPPSHSGEAETSGSSLARTLVLNQTIGVLAVGGLAVAMLHSTRLQALASRSALGAHVAAWLATKTVTDLPADGLFALVMLGAMVGWTVLVQRVFARGGAVSRAECRPGVRGRICVALYLVASASIIEEIIFRGVVLPAGSFFLGTFGGLAASAVLFGLLHFEKGRLGQLVVVGYGAILGGGVLLGSSLLACMLAHAGGNALAFFLPESLVGAGARCENGRGEG